MIALAVALQWADAMTFAAISAVGTDLAGEVSPAVPALGVGGALLAKAGIMLSLFLVARRRLRGTRILLAWSVAIGSIGLAANASYMVGAIR